MQTLRYVVVPQAVRRIMAPLLNDFIGLQKDTALVQVIGVIDAFNQSRIIASNAFNLSAVTIVAILFVLITIPQARFVDRLIERDKRACGREADMAFLEMRECPQALRADRGAARPRPRRSTSIRWSA